MTPEWSAACGIAVGALLGIGICLVAMWRRARRVTLVDRVAPFLFGVQPRPKAWWRRALDMTSRRGANETLADRLRRAGSSATVEEFRVEQLYWGLSGAGLGLVGVAVLAAGRGVSGGAAIWLVFIGAANAVLLRRWLLGEAVSSRSKRILAEFPAVAELLALAVAAGEGPIQALDRVAKSSRGELADELRTTVVAIQTGASLPSALDDLVRRTQLPSLARFADATSIAVERGTPLADVLRAQAQDVREADRRRLIEEGGRKEILMMIPVVFLILPITVVFAIFPGVLVLNFG